MLTFLIRFAFLLLASAAVAMTAQAEPTTSPPQRLSALLRDMLPTQGIEAVEARYRQLRQQGFPGVAESAGDTNALGYRLLGEGQVDAAIRIFRLNAETHPESANAFDSLGEAYLAAGDRDGAEQAYRQALALDPRSRGARYELARLSGQGWPSVPPLVLLHIVAGTLSLGVGALAMLAPKGRPVHRLAGKVFVGAMLVMAGSAMVRAAQQYATEALNLWMATFTAYLVVTGWRAAQRRELPPALIDRGMPAVALLSAGGLGTVALQGGGFAGPAYVFGSIAVLAAAADVRWLRMATLKTARRHVRHLWRIGLALFIAAGSLFLGQPQVFPYALRSSGLLLLPPLLVLLGIGYWFVRYRFAGLRRRRRPQQFDPAVAPK